MKKISLALIFMIVGCTPNKCPELPFDRTNIITYDINGNLFTGRCSTYQDDNLRSIRQYLNGKDFGKWTFYYSNGKIETTGRFNKSGQRIGKWKYYFSNGKIKQISSYSKNGEVKGKWVTYDSIGNVTSEINY